MNFWGFISFYMLVWILISSSKAQTISQSETRILLHLQQSLEYPIALASWNKWTNFCYLPSSQFVTVICSNGHITELTVIGNRTSPSQSPKPLSSTNFVVSQHTLSQKFSTESFFTDLAKLSNLKRLTLVSLGMWGTIPSKISRFQSLEVLNISSNYFYGKIPHRISSLVKLKSLVLSDNLINGTIPDLSGLNSLQEIDIGNNKIGPSFPTLSKSLVSIILRNNSIRSHIPLEMVQFKELQRFDISSNNFIGPLPPFVFSLPSLWYLNIADNELTGMLPKNTSCGKRLWFVDLSRNLLMGGLPSCMGGESNKFRKVLSEWNCLFSLNFQHPVSFCRRQALAVMPRGDASGGNENGSSGVRLGVIVGIVCGCFLLVCSVGLLIFIVLKRRSLSDVGYCNSKCDNVSVMGRNSTRPSPIVDMKYVARSTRIPTIGLPSYHDFTLSELEEATNKFDQVNLVATLPEGQVYRALLPSGSAALVKCMKLDKNSSKSLKPYVEVIPQLRHQNLVSVLGHCVVMHQDRHKGSTVFVVLEHVTNGSLREHLTDWRRKEKLKWPQRLTISVGIARGVHFLHRGMASGIFANDLKTENILLDESLTPKVSNYRIPLPMKVDTSGVQHASISSSDKEDIYKLGLILLELLFGREITSESLAHDLKIELEKGLSESTSALQHTVDLSMRGTFAYQSLKTAVEITLSCLRAEPSSRPPVEDVLWHLEYSVQAQQAWTTSGNLGLYK